ncbi:hypothetical protein V6N13_078737 [Hibiscus sabdariffa]|uniref:Uncharacterized protein n=1 Tax=Hibiscus sabdariffa TaxID=183260 RepID=A0ABR2RPC6_9ROSI
MALMSPGKDLSLSTPALHIYCLRRRSAVQDPALTFVYESRQPFNGGLSSWWFLVLLTESRWRFRIYKGLGKSTEIHCRIHP